MMSRNDGKRSRECDYALQTILWSQCTDYMVFCRRCAQPAALRLTLASALSGVTKGPSTFYFGFTSCKARIDARKCHKNSVVAPVDVSSTARAVRHWLISS